METKTKSDLYFAKMFGNKIVKRTKLKTGVQTRIDKRGHIHVNSYPMARTYQYAFKYQKRINSLNSEEIFNSFAL